MRLFVTGTDTGVGKTYISALIMKSWAEKTPAYYKPIQTGSPSREESEDILALANLTDHTFDKNLFCGQSLHAPMSPLQAAKHEHVSLDPTLILQALNDMIHRFEYLIVEGSGGLLVPITDRFFMLDLIEQSSIPVLLVTQPTIGTINHTLLTINALKARHIQVLGFIMNQFPSNPTLAEADSVNMIKSLSNIPCLGVVAANVT